ncbi:MAG: phage integrase SAM-like domain-containing protein [Flavobacterium sp.]|uniref:site-specific integrase n=1 Tax=Flavobacterium sp. TaxID=239 RepID=UPI002615D3C4|nr:site-specific integrase [Flavobacterium sp.]MDD5150227.1 phage integrase SAM-like domain-containing protein [Flavobacterium sp.]
MNNIKRNIIFSLENRKKNGIPIVENVPIRMRVIFANNRIDFSTGYRIDVEKWNSDKQRVKNGCTNKLKQSASEINTDLGDYESRIEKIFKIWETQNILPTSEILKKEFNAGQNLKFEDDAEPENEKVDLIKAFDEFVKECGRQNNWSESTFEKFDSVKNHLESFNSKLAFDYFNEFGLNEYLIFLRDTKKMRNSTIIKQLGFLKWFLRWGSNKGYNELKTYESFKPKMKSTPKKVIFLTSDELTKLREYKIPETKQYLDRVRDVFLFTCYSSLRYSDVNNLRRSDIKAEHIEVTTVKTADSLIIDLNNHSKAILDKYKDIHFENDKALPVISNQRMNDYLKELAELAGINEPIRETYYKGNERIDTVTPKYALLGTHAGRRTFICYALSLNIPVQVIMKWTGHSDYKAMKPYIDVADNVRVNAMSKFNEI